MTELQKWNMGIELWGLLIFLAFGIMVRIQVGDRREKRRIWSMLAVAGVSVIGFGLGERMDASPQLLYYGLCRVGNAVNFSCNFMLLGMILLWLDETVLAAVPMRLRLRTIVLAGNLVMLVLLAGNWYTHWLYYFDAAHRYVRGPLYSYVMGVCVLEMVVALLLVFANRKRLTKLRFLFYQDLILVSLGVLLQTVFYGLATINISMMLCVLAHTLWMQKRATDALIEQERELTHQKNSLQLAGTGLALSQLEPHFLYNTLNTIYYLCDTEPEAAQKTVRSFSEYLRTNMDAMAQNQPVPFERELNHVKRYLELETMRFEERLQVEYQIACQNFCLPLLTVQALVENAVKYGICERPQGGTITIQTRRLTDGFEVVVQDDGVGYDLSAVTKGLESGSTHYVRERLRHMCRGNLTLESCPGEGTRAILFLPETMAISS